MSRFQISGMIFTIGEGPCRQRPKIVDALPVYTVLDEPSCRWKPPYRPLTVGGRFIVC